MVEIVLLWGFGVNAEGFTVEFLTHLSLNPFFAGPCPVCCLNDKMCRGTNEKMLILSEMIVVG